MSDKCLSRKRHSITLEVKNKVIKLSEGGLSKTKIGQKLGLPRTTVQTIIKHKVKLLNEIKNACSMDLTIIRTRAGLVAEMEKLLMVWINDQAQKEVPLSLSIIQAKALSLFDALKKKERDNPKVGEETFCASKGWFSRFKKRYSLHNMSWQGEPNIADDEVATNFPKMLKDIIKQRNYAPQQIFNFDETGLLWKKMPTKTYLAGDEKFMPEIKMSKDRLTIFLGSNVMGDFRMKPLLVYHTENPWAIKGYDKKAFPVIWKSNNKASLTAQIFQEWFESHFVPAVKKYCEENNLEFRALLILDKAWGHLQSLGELNENVHVVFLPPKTRFLFQPMDQGVMVSFKLYYLRIMLTDAIRATDKEDASTLKDYWKKYNILDAVKNIGKAWSEVMVTNLKEAWKKICPQFFNEPYMRLLDHDGNFDCGSCEDIITAIVALANQLELNVDKKDITELLASHDEDLTDKEIIMTQKLEEEEPINTIPPSLSIVRLQEAFDNLEKAMEIFEEVDPNIERSSKVNNLIKKAYTSYQQIYNEKKMETTMPTKIYDFSKK